MTPTKILSTPNRSTDYKVVSRLAWVLCAAILIATAIVAVGLLRDRSADAGALQAIAETMRVVGYAVFAVTGALIVSHQPRNLVGWLLLLEGSLAFLWPLDLYFNNLAQPPAQPSVWFVAGLWLWGWLWLWYIFPILFIPLFFPTGRLPSPRWRWLVVLGLGLCAFFLLFGILLTDWGSQDGRWSVPNPIGIGFLPPDSFPMALWVILLLSFALLSVASLFVRYRRAQTIERRQIKWLLYTAGLFFIVYASAFAFSDVQEGPGNALISALLLLSIVAFPVAIAIAILRYRLYDIDIIIRKTLQYSAVTALLALIYFGSVFLLQRLFSDITGEQSPLVLVVSTLLIAALFAPVRRRIQDGIDRRFYRKKYNAQQVLAQFARTARDETDMDALLAELERVIQETLQPEGVKVWLKQTLSTHSSLNTKP